MSYYASSIRHWLIDLPELNSSVLFFSYHASEVLGIVFPILFLNTRRNSPKLHTFLVSSLIVFIALYFYLYDKPLGYATSVVELVTIVMLPFLFAAAFIALKNKQAYALYYVISLSILSTYFLAFVVAGTFLPESIPVVISMLLYVILSQMIFISFAQIDRVRALAKQAERATVSAMTDELTGIPNRRAFDGHLSDAIAYCASSEEPLSCLIMDIDSFKKYNDSLGHVAGDECLVTVATTIASVLSRSEDSVARYGGEEFAMVLPGAGKESAERIASSVIAAIHSQSIPHPDSTVAPHVTLSIGVVTTFVTDKTQAASVIDTADKQLYLAKHSGKDRFSSLEESAAD